MADNSRKNILYGEVKPVNPAGQQSDDQKSVGIKHFFIQNSVQVNPRKLNKLTQPITLQKQEIKKIQIYPTNIENLLLISPDQQQNENIFFVKFNDFKGTLKEEDVYQKIHSLPKYRYLSGLGFKVLQELSPENLNNEPDHYFESDQQLSELHQQQALKENHFVYYHRENSSVWLLNSKHPLSPVINLELGSKHYYLNALEKSLENNSFIRNIYRTKTVPSNYEYYGKQEMLIEYQLSQHLFERFNEAVLEEERNDPDNSNLLNFLNDRFAVASTSLINEKILSGVFGDPLQIQSFQKKKHEQ
jgi:hypothetical protein